MMSALYAEFIAVETGGKAAHETAEEMSAWLTERSPAELSSLVSANVVSCWLLAMHACGVPWPPPVPGSHAAGSLTQFEGALRSNESHETIPAA